MALLNWIGGRGWHVDPRTGKGDVSVVRADNAEIPHAYRSGAIDGAWVPEPTAAKLVAEGAKVLVDESTLWPGGKFVTTNVIVSQRFLAEHPDVVEAVLRGSVASNAWINANPAAARESANAALERPDRQALARRGARPGVAVHRGHRRPARLDARRAGQARGGRRADRTAGPDRDLRPDATQQRPPILGPGGRRRRRPRRAGDLSWSRPPWPLPRSSRPSRWRYQARIAHVSKSYGRQLVLDDIDLQVEPGQFVTLLGASGCGKSTLLNLVAGLDRPTAGSIETPTAGPR